MTYEIKITPIFNKWYSKLKDREARQAIAMRLERAEEGHFGDVRGCTDIISEMRIFAGKGYRLYYTVKDDTIIVLLNAGNKSNKKGQNDDIKKAVEILKELDIEREE